MKVILIEEIESLGKPGEIINVSDGYAKNFLLPKKKVLEATERNLKLLNHQKKVAENKIKKLVKDAEAFAEKLSNLNLVISRPSGENNKLFGSVTGIDIFEELKKAGFEVDKKKILLKEPIKLLGNYEIPIKLYASVNVSLKLEVTKKAE